MQALVVTNHLDTCTGTGSGRSLRKSNSGGSAGSAERELLLTGAVKKETDNGADKMARQLNKCATVTVSLSSTDFVCVRPATVLSCPTSAQHVLARAGIGRL